jgi:hypothetical protein
MKERKKEYSNKEGKKAELSKKEWTNEGEEVKEMNK